MEKSHDKMPICLPTAHRKCQEQCNSRRVKQNPVNINKREEEENVKYSSSKKKSKYDKSCRLAAEAKVKERRGRRYLDIHPSIRQRACPALIFATQCFRPCNMPTQIPPSGGV
jgi:hypothetical protein